jgi:fatty-acyl-CoA synthase
MTNTQVTPEAAGNLTSAQMLARAAGLWPNRPAMILDGARLTYATLLAEATETAHGLWGLGLRPGQHLAILMPNSVEYVRLFYAAGMVGACTLTLNARFRDAELRHALRASDADMLVIGGQNIAFQDYRTALTRLYPELADWDGDAHLALPDLPRLKTILNLCDPRETRWPGAARLDAAGKTVPPATIEGLAISPDSPALMMFSSGTTAHPKACLLSHRVLSRIGAAFAARFGLGPKDKVYNPLPFFHMSTMLPMAACRASGAAQICTLHFNPGEALDVMEAERPSFAYVSFPTLVSGLVGHESFARRDMGFVKFLHCVGPPELMRRYMAAFPNAFYVNAYGLTEAAGVPVWSHPDDPMEVSFATSGRPFDGIEIKVVDPETLADQPADTTGEIWIRGWPIFAGYYGDAEATARTMQPDGWLRTGDLGRVTDSGHVIFDGRLKDMLKIGGENVAALEIEALLCRHPQIANAQVIAAPDDHLMEVAAAYVELVPGVVLTPAEVVAHCLGRIASFKVPRYVRIVSEWPMSTTKIQKFRLPRDFAASEKFDIASLTTRG